MMPISDICSIAQAVVTESIYGRIWAIITFLWSWYGLLLFIGIVVWCVVEIYTRYGNFHYNSDNGFSPTFNRFVGSGTYLGFQTVLLFFFQVFFGPAVYCMPLPYAIHTVVFLSTGLFLHLIGFWPYLKEPGTRKRKKRR